MSSPTYPRSGRDGDWWGFAKLNRKMPHPLGQCRCTNPLLIPHITRWGLVGESTLNFILRQNKYPPNIVRHTTGIQRTFYAFANAPTLGKILRDNPLLWIFKKITKTRFFMHLSMSSPTYPRSGSGWGLVLKLL